MKQISIAIDIIEERYRESANGNTINTHNDCVPIAPIKITQKDVHQVIKEWAEKNDKKGIGIRTVKEYWNVEQIDIDEVVRTENERIEITYVPKSDSVLDTQILDEIDNEGIDQPDIPEDDGESPLTKEEQEYLEELEVRRNKREKDQEERAYFNSLYPNTLISFRR